MPERNESSAASPRLSDRAEYPKDCPNCGLWLTAESMDCPRCMTKFPHESSAEQKREQALEAVRRAEEAGHTFHDQPMRAPSAAQGRDEREAWELHEKVRCADPGQKQAAATATRPTLVGPLPKFPKVRCDSCGQIYFSTVAVVVPTTKPCPNCGGGSFSTSFDSRPLGVRDA